MIALWWQCPCTSARRLETRRCPSARPHPTAAEELAQRDDLLAQHPRVAAVRHEARELVAEDRAATWLEGNDRRPCRDVVAKRSENPLEIVPREIEHAVVVQGPAATEVTARYVHAKACVFEDVDGGLRDLGGEVVIERVGPEEDPLTVGVSRGPRMEPGQEGLRRERGDRALGRDPHQRLGQCRQTRELGHEVREPGREARETRPLVDEPEGVRGPWPQAAFPVVREEFGLVGGDVDVHGAVPLAALAGEAEVEGFLHVGDRASPS